MIAELPAVKSALRFAFSVLSQRFAAQKCRESTPGFVAVLAGFPTRLRAASRQAPISTFLALTSAAFRTIRRTSDSGH